MRIKPEQFALDMLECDNIVSSKILYVLKNKMSADDRQAPKKVVICGFGAGYSWASALLRLPLV